MTEFALSIQQPWCWLIANRWKDIENRSWSTRFRGPILLHAGKKGNGDAWDDLAIGFCHPVTGDALADDLRSAVAQLDSSRDPWLGGIVGEAEIVDCVTSSTSPWFVGKYGFVLRNARPLPFVPCRGQLGFFRPDFSPAVCATVKPVKPDLFARPALDPQAREE